MDLSVTETVFRLLLAAALGGAIGLERELDGQPAGFRTHVLVCLGAALFTLGGTGVGTGDPTRVAAQIATGIGFLGAGAILQDRGGHVRGLTTAAALWVTASLGMAAGFGEWVAGVTVAATAIVVLSLLKYVERSFFPRRRGQEVKVELEEGVTIDTAVPRIISALGAFDVHEITLTTEGRQRLTGVTHSRGSISVLEIAKALQAVDGIANVDVRAQYGVRR